MIDLSSLGFSSRSENSVLSYGHGKTYLWREFCGSVEATSRKIGHARSVLIATSHAWNFLIAIFASMNAGARVVIPHNLQSGTLASLEQDCSLKIDDDFLVCEQTGDFSFNGKELKLDFFTSGSTGSAKKVVRDLWQMEAEVKTIQSLWPGRVGVDAVSFSTVPHQHVYGLVFHMLWPLLTHRAFFAEQFNFWEELFPVLRCGAVIVSSPSHLSRMGGLKPLNKDMVPSAVLTGGAPLSDSSAKEAADILGLPVNEFYGSTETGAIATRQRSAKDPLWLPFPGYRLSRTDSGLLRIDAPLIIAGSGFEIQDRVQFESDGCFRLLGRADRTVKVEGKRIDLGDVEAGLRSIEDVAECAVISLGQEKAVLAVAVVLNLGGRSRLLQFGHYNYCQALKKKLSLRIDSVGLPKKWIFLDELPMNALGKRAVAIRKLFVGSHDE